MADKERRLIIEEWMLSLDLKGTEINAFALVYGLYLNGMSYTGSASYLAKWLKCSKIAAYQLLAKLEKKGYIKKHKTITKQGKNCVWDIEESSIPPIQESYTPNIKKLYTPIKESYIPPIQESYNNNTIIENTNREYTNNTLHEQAQQIYDAYPSKDIHNNNRPTGKCKKDKLKIETMLKKGVISYDNLLLTIQLYVKDCTTNKRYLKNLATILNNLPDYDDEIEREKTSKERETQGSTKYQNVETSDWINGRAI